MTSPGEFSLILDAGTTTADDAIEDLGHEPNGYFWEGIAQLLVAGLRGHAGSPVGEQAQ